MLEGIFGKHVQMSIFVQMSQKIIFLLRRRPNQDGNFNCIIS